jgi:integrase
MPTTRVRIVPPAIRPAVRSVVLVYYRRAQGKQGTNKRQPPMPIPPRLLAHLLRWNERKIIARHFVEFNGEGVSSVKTAFKHAVTLAKLGPGVSPHALRHTAATWSMQNGTDPWQAAGYLGMASKHCCACTGTTTRII